MKAMKGGRVNRHTLSRSKWNRASACKEMVGSRLAMDRNLFHSTKQDSRSQSHEVDDGVACWEQGGRGK